MTACADSRTCTWLGEAAHGHGEIGKTRTVVFDRLETGRQLVEFYGDCTCNEGGGGGDGGDNFTGNLLHCRAICCSDGVARDEIGKEEQ